MNKVYRDAVEQIKLDGEDYSDEEMLSVYAEQKKELDALHAIVGALFIKYAIDGLLKMNASQKAGTGIKEHLKTMGKHLGENEVKKASEILSTVYKDTYYKNLYTLESGMTINLKLPILKKEFVDAAVNAKFKGEFFSDRIWKNKSDLIDHLQSSMTEAMKGGKTIDSIGRDIRDRFNVTAYDSSRLLQTEVTRCQSQASIDIGNSTGVEKHMWSATLDTKACAECAELDGKIFDINDDSSPEIPLHPEDRCCWINIPYEGWQATSRKDNSTKEVIDYVSYSEWAKEKGIS